MLKIRQEHLDFFAKSGLKRFAARMNNHVRECWPEECAKLCPENSLAAVERLIERARTWQVHNEYDTGRFIDIAFATENLEWDDQDWAQSLLKDPNLATQHKMNLLWTHVEEHLTD